jgi:BetR domain
MTADEQPTDARDLSLAAHLVRALLERHTVPKHRHAPVLGEILGLGYHAAHRRINSNAPWSLEELQVVASHFGETLSQLVESQRSSATFVTATLRLPCRFTLGSPVVGTARPLIVAIRGNTEWLVLPSADVGNAQCYVVSSLIIEPAQATNPRIAVLDDEPTVAEGICADLRAAGFAAKPYFALKDLEADFKRQRFSAYIIDWALGDTTPKQLITDIRAYDPFCPIAVLTGRLEGGAVDEGEVADAMAGPHMMFYAKPLPIKIVAQRLKRAFGTPAIEGVPSGQ